MVTKVGMQDNFADAINDLVELEYDVSGAYLTAINKISSSDSKMKLQEFHDSLQRYIGKLSELARNHNQIVPTSAGVLKSFLVKGKVVLADMMGDDQAILGAMLDNEQDITVAYENMLSHLGIWLDAKEVINEGLSQNQERKIWFQNSTKNNL